MEDVVNSEPRRPETEVSSKAKRRRFTAEYKQRILREAAAAHAPGELGALLRREGLYSSHIANWREQARRGELKGLSEKKRGPKPKPADPKDARIAQLERELRKQQARAERAEALVELQKKVSVVMGIALPSDEEPNT